MGVLKLGHSYAYSYWFSWFISLGFNLSGLDDTEARRPRWFCMDLNIKSMFKAIQTLAQGSQAAWGQFFSLDWGLSRPQSGPIRKTEILTPPGQKPSVLRHFGVIFVTFGSFLTPLGSFLALLGGVPPLLGGGYPPRDPPFWSDFSISYWEIPLTLAGPGTPPRVLAKKWHFWPRGGHFCMDFNIKWSFLTILATFGPLGGSFLSLFWKKVTKIGFSPNKSHFGVLFLIFYPLGGKKTPQIWLFWPPEP